MAKILVSALMSMLLISCSTVLFTSCTFNVSMMHSQGETTDTIDDTADNTPNIAPSLSVPLK